MVVMADVPKRYRQWKLVMCGRCEVVCESLTSTETHTLYKCPCCGYSRYVSRPTEPPPKIVIQPREE